MSFIKRTEDFVCEYCGKQVVGDGYTNHCPKCLWSTHVDNDPGDRASACGGMMEPKSARQKSSTFILTHKCQKCGHEKKNKISPNDDFDAVIRIASDNSKRLR